MSDSPLEVSLGISLDKSVDRANLAVVLGSMIGWGRWSVGTCVTSSTVLT